MKVGGWGLGTRPLEREGFRACEQITYNAETAEPAEKKCLKTLYQNPDGALTVSPNRKTVGAGAAFRS